MRPDDDFPPLTDTQMVAILLVMLMTQLVLDASEAHR